MGCEAGAQQRQDGVASTQRQCLSMLVAKQAPYPCRTRQPFIDNPVVRCTSPPLTAQMLEPCSDTRRSSVRPTHTRTEVTATTAHRHSPPVCVALLTLLDAPCLARSVFNAHRSVPSGSVDSSTAEPPFFQHLISSQPSTQLHKLPTGRLANTLQLGCTRCNSTLLHALDSITKTTDALNTM